MHSAHKVLFGLIAAAAVGSASDVTQLKKDTFDEFVKTNDIVLAECKHSTIPQPPSPDPLCLHRRRRKEKRTEKAEQRRRDGEVTGRRKHLSSDSSR